MEEGNLKRDLPEITILKEYDPKDLIIANVWHDGSYHGGIIREANRELSREELDLIFRLAKSIYSIKILNRN